MEKEALIDIILNDIKEIETLVRTFTGKSNISPAFLNLTKKKLANITEELDLLEGLGDSTPVASTPMPEPSESSLTSATSSPETIIDGKKIAESAGRLIREEATDVDVSNSEPSKELTPSSSLIEEKMEMSIKTESHQLTSDKPIGPVVTESKPAPISTPEKPKIPKAPKTVKGSGILGEQIGKDKTSVYERVATKKEQTESIKQIGKPVNDIRKAFGLNDRFYFQRELFNGNPELFNQTLDQINQMDSYDSATHFLISNFQWSEDNDVAESFLRSVKRRFI